LRFAITALDALDGADALLIATEWPEYRQADWTAVRRRMAHPHVLDGRNICDPARMAALGFVYRGIGRGAFENFAAIPAVVQPRAREPALRHPLAATSAMRVNAASRA
jgi:hypothetical protein